MEGFGAGCAFLLGLVAIFATTIAMINLLVCYQLKPRMWECTSSAIVSQLHVLPIEEVCIQYSRRTK